METRQYTFTAIFEEAEEGGYIAYLKEFPGINTQGETKKEAEENLREASQMMFKLIMEEAQERLKDKKYLQQDFKVAM